MYAKNDKGEYPANGIEHNVTDFNLSSPKNFSGVNATQNFSFDGDCYKYETFYKDNRSASHSSFSCVNGSYIVQQPAWTNFRYGGNRTQYITRSFIQNEYRPDLFLYKTLLNGTIAKMNGSTVLSTAWKDS